MMPNIVDLPQRDTTAAADWSDWDRWWRAHFAAELKALHTALGQLLATERQKLEHKTNEFELKIAKLAGAVDILRGAAPPPPAKFPTIKAWSADTIYHEGDIVHVAAAAGLEPLGLRIGDTAPLVFDDECAFLDRRGRARARSANGAKAAYVRARRFLLFCPYLLHAHYFPGKRLNYRPSTG